MTVRRMTKTTISLIFLLVGLGFLRLYYVELVNTHILRRFSFFVNITERLFPYSHIGSFYTNLFYYCVVLIIIARMIDVIHERKVGFELLSSFGPTLFLTILATVALCVESLSILQLWGVLYILLLVGLHNTLKRILLHLESVGGYSSLKLPKRLFLTIKDIVENAVSVRLVNYKNPIDEITTLILTTVIIVFEVITVIAFISYIATHWRLLFLSHLVAMF